MQLQLQKKKGGPKGKSRPPVRSSRVPTFFDYFSPPVVPETDSELTDPEMDALQNALEKDYELGYGCNITGVCCVMADEFSCQPLLLLLLGGLHGPHRRRPYAFQLALQTVVTHVPLADKYKKDCLTPRRCYCHCSVAVVVCCHCSIASAVGYLCHYLVTGSC